MNRLTSLFKADNREAEISAIVPLSDCSHDCEGCTSKFPTSVKIETEDMYNSSKRTGIHFVVPTGKADWPHNATEKVGTVENACAEWCGTSFAKGLFDEKLSVKTATSSLPIDLFDMKASTGERNDVLILPFFVWVRKVQAEDVSKLLDELVPQLIEARDEKTTPPTKVQGYTVDKSAALSFIFLCSHTTRDKRCGVTAPIMKREMDHRLRETGHYRDVGDDTPDGVNVSFINHIGGHKYAANVIIYLRTGEIIWLAKCTPTNAQPIIDETVLGGGRVWTDLVRVVQKEKAIEW